MRAIQNTGSIKRIPVMMMQRISAYNKYLREYALVHGGKQPTDEEIKQALNLTNRQYSNMIKAIAESYVVSLEEKIDSEDDSLTVGDTIPSNENIEEYCIDGEMSYQLWKIVDELPDDRKKTIVKQIYQENKTMQQIADEMCVSRARVNQIEKQALQILKKDRRVRAIAEAYNYDCKFAYRSTVALFKQKQTSSVELIAMRRAELDKQLQMLDKKLLETIS